MILMNSEEIKMLIIYQKMKIRREGMLKRESTSLKILTRFFFCVFYIFFSVPFQFHNFFYKITIKPSELPQVLDIIMEENENIGLM